MLERERKYFEEIKEELLAHHEGKVALIFESELIDTFDTSELAYAEGVRRFGQRTFLVKPITKQEATVTYPALNLGLI